MCAVTLATAPFFAARVSDGWIVGGMLVGTYTGSTPNMVAVAKALGADHETVVLVTGADLVVAAPFIFLLMSPAVKLLNFLPASKGDASDAALVEVGHPPVPPLVEWIKSLVLAVAVVAVAGGLSVLVPEDAQQLVAILGVTTLGVLGSLSKPVRSIPASALLGDYFILVFCVGFGSLADLRVLGAQASLGALLGWTALVMLGGVALHVGLCRVFGIDRDTAVITITAGLYGPAMIGPVAANLRNNEMMLSGVTAALAGLAVGNYLGLLVAWGVRAMVGA
ncbi:DUF819 family protein, partial [Planctomycetota bacterium]|nr:DUF819 family protein [Planctomycetota bacterium]